jgi:serine/threonine-protein kinase HipA
MTSNSKRDAPDKGAARKDAPKTAYVWIWLPEATSPVVACRIELDNGIYTFTYGRSYIDRKQAIPIYLPELPLERGTIFPEPPLLMANCLRDGAPDAWGRRVIINRLTGKTGDDARDIEFDELTFMLNSGSDRAGALDFQQSSEVYAPREYVSATLEQLLEAAECVERGEPMPQDLDNALLHGSSIGGARPKALIDDGAKKFIAKFSATNDTYSVVKAEFVAMRLAVRVGLNAAPVALQKAAGKDVLLVERFDRTRVKNGWRRRALVSALTLFGLDELQSRHAGYTDLADIIRARFTEPRATLRELYARMVFNVLVGNTDDHARNQAAFWDGRHLALTPAYDICPQSRNNPEANQAIYISDQDRRSQLEICRLAAPRFLLNDDEARVIINGQVQTIREGWKAVCDEAGLSQVDRAFLWRRQILNSYAFEDYAGGVPEGL